MLPSGEAVYTQRTHAMQGGMKIGSGFGGSKESNTWREGS